ncbi:hypothetical protein PC129_g5388 [Phytophthora cactorum]|uniref:Uncharacterized protein n=1 Tax=Phytophthora cactorum TaxID=29920 RepID=A0A8T1IF83_9STRA|nr:hypothetical protein Pcac1_g8204 [Phytophthora cactorum]KAG2827024.1 hypothetical protein PC112_g9016 [Phytophthora cactorum]KAG2828804.1 hypothetical protein PC111_g8025 [Phytophthora cactorum]KAG2858898.1 hypothetical protein PC113_g9390 [Phytophthora cactorum]KAG2909714.1 hypothetical protein PC114_g10004 [Phytophthora cactorum]
MRQGFVLLVFAVVLLASCGAASPPTDAISIFKVEPFLTETSGTRCISSGTCTR